MLVRKALTLAEKENYQVGIANCLNTLGWCYFNTGDNEQGIDNIQKSVQISKKLGSYKALSISYFNLSSIYLSISNYPEALKYITKSLRITEQNPEIGDIVPLYKNIAVIYREQGERDKAVYYFKKAIQLCVDKGQFDFLMDIKMSLGILYYQEGDNKKALQLFEEVYLYSAKEHNIKSMSLAREHCADVFFQEKDYEKANKYYSDAKDGYVKINSFVDIAFINIQIAKTNIAESNYDVAIELLKSSIDISIKNSFDSYLLDAYYEMSDAYEGKKDYASAFEFYKKANLLNERFNSEAQKKEMNQLRISFETREKDKKIKLLYADKLLMKKKKERQLLLFAGVFLTLSLLIVIVYSRSQLLKKKNIITIQEKRIAEQARVEMEQKALRAQMNPHFIFNCLNTIDSFILQKREDDASTLIQQFSQLTRKILDHSYQKEVSIEKEFEILTIYLDIEKTRSGDSFQYEIDIDKSTKDILVPAMLIQPFVENAVLHGIRHRQDKDGMIKISSNFDNKGVKITVYDNGIGRKKASEINSNRKISHISRAIQLTEDRLALLYEDDKQHDNIHYTDLENPSGTQVEIFIPLKFDKI